MNCTQKRSLENRSGDCDRRSVVIEVKIGDFIGRKPRYSSVAVALSLQILVLYPAPSLAQPERAGEALAPTEAQQATATLKFEKGYISRLFIGGNQTYWLSDVGTCSTMRQVSHLLWTTADAPEYKVTSGHVIEIFSDTQYIHSTGYMAANGTDCYLTATFTPTQDRHYAVKSVGYPGSQCSMSVIDEESGLPPSDLVVGDGGSCVFDIRRALDFQRLRERKSGNR